MLLEHVWSFYFREKVYDLIIIKKIIIVIIITIEYICLHGAYIKIFSRIEDRKLAYINTYGIIPTQDRKEN